MILRTITISELTRLMGMCTVTDNTPTCISSTAADSSLDTVTSISAGGGAEAVESENVDGHIVEEGDARGTV